MKKFSKWGNGMFAKQPMHDRIYRRLMSYSKRYKRREALSGAAGPS